MADNFYKKLINTVQNNTLVIRDNRTNIPTYSVFGVSGSIDCSKYVAVLTLKKVPIKLVVAELIWFLSGSTNVKDLQKLGCNIWNDNSTREFLDKRNLPWETGMIGPGYGHQWRNAGNPYKESIQHSINGDQIRECLRMILEDPFSRRIILSSWNVPDIPKMALPPCHVLVQFYVSHENPTLHCQLYQRSADLFLGVPFNIASYSILLHLFAYLSNLKPGNLYVTYGDLHIYQNHTDQIRQVQQLETKEYPTLSFSNRLKPIEVKNGKIANIEQFNNVIDQLGKLEINDFIFTGYKSHPRITGKMAV